MSLDAKSSKLKNINGKVTVETLEGKTFVSVEGFKGDNCSCRDVAVQASMWAIGELQRETLLTIQEAGTGNIGIVD